MEGPETLAALEDFNTTLLDVAVKEELSLENGINLPTSIAEDGLPEEITKDVFALEEESQDAPYRSRCNTWPRLQNPMTLFFASSSNNNSPGQHSHLHDPEGSLGSSAGSFDQDRGVGFDEPTYSPSSINGPGSNIPLPLVNEEMLEVDTLDEPKPSPTSDQRSPGSASASAVRPKISSRRNPWGNLSYADLITQAIQSSSDKRLTLAQIYEWLVKNVPYFQSKGDNVSSLGWKNSIRHNLSLHSKFIRVQNEGAGKSSWWMLNPEDSKPVASGKQPRRRANTLDSTQKFAGRRGPRVGGKRRDSFSGRLNKELKASSSPQNTLHPDASDSHRGSTHSPEYSTFRPRTSSNASSCGRISPFRPRTLSNSSTCDHNSPSSQDLVLDGVNPLSPWNQGALLQFQEQLNLDDNSNGVRPMEEDPPHQAPLNASESTQAAPESPDDVKFIDLGDMELEPLMSKILAAAAEETASQRANAEANLVQSPTTVNVSISSPMEARSPMGLLKTHSDISSLGVMSPPHRDPSPLPRQPSPQLPHQLQMSGDHLNSRPFAMFDDSALRELREIQMEQEELVEQTTSYHPTMALTSHLQQTMPHKIKILEQRDPPPIQSQLHTEAILSLGQGLSQIQPSFMSQSTRNLASPPSSSANHFIPVPPAMSSMDSLSLASSYPPVTNNSFLNSTLSSQPLSTLSESVDESPYFEEFLKTEFPVSTLSEFDFDLTSGLESVFSSENTANNSGGRSNSRSSSEAQNLNSSLSLSLF